MNEDDVVRLLSVQETETVFENTVNGVLTHTELVGSVSMVVLMLRQIGRTKVLDPLRLVGVLVDDLLYLFFFGRCSAQNDALDPVDS